MANTNFVNGFEKSALNMAHKLFKRHGVGVLSGAAFGGADAVLNLEAAKVGLKFNRDHVSKTKQDKAIVNKMLKEINETEALKKTSIAGAIAGGLIGGILQGRMRKDRLINVNNRRFFRNARRRFSGTKKPIDHTPHLSILGLSGKESSKAEVKKSYKDLVKKHHPDHGGRHEDMSRVNNAMDNIEQSTWFNKLSFLNGFNNASN